MLMWLLERKLVSVNRWHFLPEQSHGMGCSMSQYRALCTAWYMAWYMRVSTSGLSDYGLPPHIRSVKWHGMHALWLGIYRMVYSMLYGMVCVCLHFRVWPSMACSLLSDLCHCMVCSTAWCITCYMTRYRYVSTSVKKAMMACRHLPDLCHGMECPMAC